MLWLGMLNSSTKNRRRMIEKVIKRIGNMIYDENDLPDI